MLEKRKMIQNVVLQAYKCPVSSFKVFLCICSLAIINLVLVRHFSTYLKCTTIESLLVVFCVLKMFESYTF